MYRQTKAGIAQREALTVIRDQIGDKDWIRDESFWQELKSEFSSAAGGMPNYALSESLQDFALIQKGRAADSVSDNVIAITKKYDESQHGSFTAGGSDSKKQKQAAARQAAALSIRGLIIRRLNRFEMIAIGIHNGSIDEAMYRLWWETGTVSEFLDHQKFIAKARESRARVFQNFHRLAHHFATDEQRQSIELNLGQPNEVHPHAKLARERLLEWLRHWKTLRTLAVITVVAFVAVLCDRTLRSAPKNAAPPGFNVTPSSLNPKND